MPVLTKEFELEDGSKILVRQAGGMTKLKIENIQARVFRDHMHFGLDPTEWTEEQQGEFTEALEVAGAGMEAQMMAWIPKSLTSKELRMILGFVRGDDPEGAPPLDNSAE